MKGGKTMKIKDVRSSLPQHPTKRFRKRNLNTITDIAIHHSATRTGSSLSFARHHVNNNGWAGIGYHYVILPDGTVEYCGDLDTIRANVGNNNSYIIGVCLVGDFTTNQKPTELQLASAFALIDDLKIKIPTIQRVRGHREFPGQTSTCPAMDMNKFREQYEKFSTKEGVEEIMSKLPSWAGAPAREAIDKLAERGLLAKASLDTHKNEKALGDPLEKYLFWIMLERVIEYIEKEGK